MNPKPDNSWNDLAAKIRRLQTLHDMGPEEAEAELAAAPEEPLSDTEIEAIIESATSGELATWTPPPSLDWLENVGTDVVSEDVMQLNRNLGEPDPDTDALIDEIRRKALGDDETNQQDKSDGVDGEGTPSGDGR